MKPSDAATTLEPPTASKKPVVPAELLHNLSAPKAASSRLLSLFPARLEARPNQVRILFVSSAFLGAEWVCRRRLLQSFGVHQQPVASVSGSDNSSIRVCC
jgi:hypothetical protein